MLFCSRSRSSFNRHPKRFRRIINHPAFVKEFGSGEPPAAAPKKKPVKRRKKGESASESEEEKPKEQVEASRRRNVYGAEDVRFFSILLFSPYCSLADRCLTSCRRHSKRLRRESRRTTPTSIYSSCDRLRCRSGASFVSRPCQTSKLPSDEEACFCWSCRLSDAQVVDPNFMDEVLRLATVARPFIR